MIERCLCPQGMACFTVFFGALIAWIQAHPKWPFLAALWKAVMGAALFAFAVLVPASAQEMDRDEAKAEAEALAGGLEQDVKSGATQSVTSLTVPGFTGTDLPEMDFFSAPSGLVGAGAAAALLNPEALAITDSMTFRPIVTPEELATWTSNGLSVEADATSIVSEYAGTYGDCTAEVTGGTETTYSYTCNEGETLLEFTSSCQVSLTVSIGTEHVHQCRGIWLAGDLSWEQEPHCWAIASEPSCGPLVWINGPSCTGPIGDGLMCDDQIWQATCDVDEIDGVPAAATLPGPPAFSWDLAACDTMDVDANCSFLGETCLEPAEERLIDGVLVFRDCWRYERSYQCAALGGSVDDCDVPEGCTLKNSTCLSVDEDTGTCRTTEHVYQCTVEGTSPGAVGYCEEDVYCIDGDCETLTRPQNTEFPDAVSALAMLGELEDDVDEGTLEIFPGEYAKCDKLVGGLKNCCSNDGFLTEIGFECSGEEKALAERQKAGLCHYVGTYCSDKTLFGICLEKRKTFCCFSGILARLIHEQGRPQVGWDWGSTKSPDCSGYTVALFQSLDLSVMDFSEFYAGVLEAFTGPDGDAAAEAITTKIIESYACPPNC